MLRQPFRNRGSEMEIAASAPGVVKDADDRTFMADVIEASMAAPVIVDFWAPWCGPCKQLGPVLEKVVSNAGGKVSLVKVDIDKSPVVAQQMRIQSIPAVYAFDQGRPVDAFMGAVPESQVKAFVERLVGGPVESAIEAAVEQARAALEEGDAQTAGAIFNEVLKQEPENAAAIAGLAQVFLAVDEIEQARAMLGRLPEGADRDPAVAAAVSAVELAEQSADAGDTADLRRAVEADPDDHRSRFDLAMALFGGGRHEEAAEELLELYRRDREWNEGAARGQLVKFFEAWGPTHELTVGIRRRLSTLMFS